jgi:hypothetical protein
MTFSRKPQWDLWHFLGTLSEILLAFSQLVLLRIRSRRALAAENLFLRKQLALFQERPVKPHRATDGTRWVMATLSRWFDWRNALVAVRPDPDRLASPAIPPALASEIATSWAPSRSRRTAAVNPHYGSGESYLD